MPRRVTKLPTDGGAERAEAEEREAQQRVKRLRGVQAVAGEQRERDEEQADDFAGAQRVLAENFEHVGEQRDAGAEEDEADDVERIGVLFAIVGQDGDRRDRGRRGRSER